MNTVTLSIGTMTTLVAVVGLLLPVMLVLGPTAQRGMRGMSPGGRPARGSGERAGIDGDQQKASAGIARATGADAAPAPRGASSRQPMPSRLVALRRGADAVGSFPNRQAAVRYAEEMAEQGGPRLVALPDHDSDGWIVVGAPASPGDEQA